METDVEKARLALRGIYARAAQEIAEQTGLFCELSGRCCRFTEAGHQLYLTALEYAEMEAVGEPVAADPDRCPWLRDGLCSNRSGRALACRTYFCSDEALAATVTERWHNAIRRLHEEYGLPYDYRSLHDHMDR